MQITIANGKGGAGKTTVSLLLAAALREAGHRVAVTDCDPQGTACILAPHLGLTVVRPGIQTDAAVLLVDTAPRLDHPPTLEAYAAADVVVLVTTPSPADLGATAATAAVLRQQRGERKTVVLLNSVVARTRLARTVADMHSQLPFRTLTHTLARRQCYQLATVEGWGALNAEAREELFGVALEILGL